MAFWNRHKTHWDEQTDEYYADRRRELKSSTRMRVLPHLLALLFVGILFAGGVGVLAGETMLEKTLTSLAQPCGILWLSLIVLIYFSMLLRQAWPTCIGLFCFLVLTIAGNSFVSNWLAAQREAAYQGINPLTLETYDTVFVLGGGTTSRVDGFSQLNSAGDRIMTAARMYHAGKAKKIICTGTQTFRTTEKDLHPNQEAANILMDLNVPRGDIMQMKGENSSDEIRNIRRWQQANPNPGRVGILTSAWHLKRVMRLADKEGVIADPIPANFISIAFAPTPNLLIPTASNLEATRTIIKEHLADWVGR